MSRTGVLVTIAAIAIGILLLFQYVFNQSKSGAGSPLTKPTLQVPEIASLGVHNWHEYTSPASEFKVLFPTLPQHATENTNDPKTNITRQYDVYVSEKDDGTLYMISRISLPDSAYKEPEETILGNVLNEMMEASSESQLKSKKMVQYRGKPSVDFNIENGDLNVDGKAFLTDHTLYILSSVAKQSNHKVSEFDFFVNSFQLLEKPETSQSAK